VLSGVLLGAFAGVGAGDLLAAARPLLFLAVLPLLVFPVLRGERRLRVALGLVAALAAVKAALGLLGWATGSGVPVPDGVVAFDEPAANALLLLVLLVVVAALLGRVRLPRPVLLGAPLLLLALVLSERRSLWIAAALGLLLVVALGATAGGRPLLLPAAALVAAAVWVVALLSLEPQTPLVARTHGADRASVEPAAEARYRADERANVLQELERRPVTGLGLGVPWAARVPLPVELGGGRLHVHAAALWHWLKLGLLGLAAYLALLLAAGRLAWLAWRRADRALHRALGLGALSWLLAMAVAETAGAYTGVDLRFSVLLGALVGLLAALPRSALGR